MKNLFVLIMTLMLAGCFYQTVSSDDIKLATMYCEDKGGIRKIHEHATGATQIECNDDPAGSAPTSEEAAAKSLVLDKIMLNHQSGTGPAFVRGTTISCFAKPIRQPGETDESFLARKRLITKWCTEYNVDD